ncbi:MAG: PAS domain-containing sensor histidine kinase [Candidatus Heimdallarchaeota archaeon]|nr:PAS domain-containing sensor histidine kinase [Candidatus Heimdallarchaeota archaeon]MBY8995089.1 PAS domain-containing sensor histidine kinase [Candidatus Heimdallarchaeota archaeon]
MPKAETHFASPERLEKGEIKEQYEKVLSLEHTKEILNSFPIIVVVLNKQRQVVFANDTFVKILGIDEFEDALGQRPGELLNCVNSAILEGGCGTSRNCRYCGVVLTILESQKTGKEQENEARLTTRQQNKIVPLDLHVISKPLLIDKDQFTVVIMMDISTIKRKEYLERTFMHDMINTTWSLSGRIEFFPRDGLNEIQDEYFNRIKIEINKLLDDIQAQRDLLKLDKKELVTEFSEVDSLELIQMIIHTLSTDKTAKGKRIAIAKDSVSLKLKTDERLLRRSLINLLKNALEASTSDEEVIIGCKQFKNDIEFWVQNKAVLSEEVKSQVFQRFFSTKGLGRGLGTYSVRILVEEHLNGQVNFESSEKIGTIFRIILPVEVN